LSIDDLVLAARAGELSDQVEMIYVSPLKALNNDVQKNLETPLAGIAALAERGVSLEIHAVVNDKRGAHRNDAGLSACRITWRSLGWTACYASL
jgi:Lhr-like helicase